MIYCKIIRCLEIFLESNYLYFETIYCYLKGLSFLRSQYNTRKAIMYFIA